MSLSSLRVDDLIHRAELSKMAVKMYYFDHRFAFGEEQRKKETFMYGQQNV